MRNPYTRPGGMFGRRAAGGFTRASASAPAGPTVILNAAYATDTLLDQGLVPITEGGELDSWAFATGGTFDYGTAFLAGASARPIYVAASGVHTAGTNAALACATPVTIPADADCVIYLKLVTDGSPLFIGRSNGDDYINFDPYAGFSVTVAAGSYYSAFVEPGPGTFLVRARRTAGVWALAYTGQVEVGGDTYAGAITLNTLLGRGTAGSGTLNAFVPSGQYLQKAYIYHGSSSPDTAYETANGGTL